MIDGLDIRSLTNSGYLLSGLDGSFAGTCIEIVVKIVQISGLVTATVVPYDHPGVVYLSSLSRHNKLIGVVAQRRGFLAGPTAAYLRSVTILFIPNIAVDGIAKIA